MKLSAWTRVSSRSKSIVFFSSGLGCSNYYPTGVILRNSDGFSLSSSSSREHLVHEVQLFRAFIYISIPPLFESTLVFLVAESLQKWSLICSILKHCAIKLKGDSCFVSSDCSDRCKVSIASFDLISVEGKFLWGNVGVPVSSLILRWNYSRFCVNRVMKILSLWLRGNWSWLTSYKSWLIIVTLILNRFLHSKFIS